MDKDNINLLNEPPCADELWQGDYKIPWDDPEFSRRMLAEHLTQDHDLASRRSETIRAQARWLCENMLNGSSARILDLGCGPGLYASHFAEQGHSCLGIDFGPASIEYAKAHSPEGCRFRLGNVLEVDLEGPHDLVVMLYGEINVFPPDSTQQLLARAYDALAPGGSLVLEAHTPETVQALGQGRSWQADVSGLFSDSPHVTLTEGFFIDGVAVQRFHVVGSEEKAPRTYRSTTKSWTHEEFKMLLQEAGFSSVIEHADWPGSEHFMLLSATKKQFINTALSGGENERTYHQWKP